MKPSREVRAAHQADDGVLAARRVVLWLTQLLGDCERVVDELERLPWRDVQTVLGHLQAVRRVSIKLDEQLLVRIVREVRDGEGTLPWWLQTLRSEHHTADLAHRIAESGALAHLEQACDRNRRRFLEPLHEAIKLIWPEFGEEDISTFKKRTERGRQRSNDLREHMDRFLASLATPAK